MTLQVLYVCQNGKGRSQTLSAYTENFLTQRGIEGINVTHSGINYTMIEKLRRDNHDTFSFTFNYLLKKEGIVHKKNKIVFIGELVKEPDLILTVDDKTLEKVCRIYPPYREISCVIGDLTNIKPREIKGPYDQTWNASSKIEGYKKVNTCIKDHAKKVCTTLETLSKSNLIHHLKKRV